MHITYSSLHEKRKRERWKKTIHEAVCLVKGPLQGRRKNRIRGHTTTTLCRLVYKPE